MRKRLNIMSDMSARLKGDLETLQNYDFRQNDTLETILNTNRGLSADVRGKQVKTVGGMASTRMVVEVGNKKGVFTEDFNSPDMEDEYSRIIREASSAELRKSENPKAYEAFRALVRLMLNDPGITMDSAWFKDRDKTEEALRNPDNNPDLSSFIRDVNTKILVLKLNGENCPAVLKEDVDWLKNPAVAKELSKALPKICQARTEKAIREKANIQPKSNVPRRNAAMSVVADRLGMGKLIARSKVMKLETDQGEKSGVFMEWANGTDFAKSIESGELIPDKMGLPLNFNSGKVLKAAANLQVLDYICGNVDRHAGNMMYRFTKVNGVMTLTGIQGIDNDMSFGNPQGDKGRLADPDNMRVMTRSAAEAVLNLTKDDLKYSLYGLVKENEIDQAWNRTRKLQNKIRESLKIKWKHPTTMRHGAIHILDDRSPAWDKLDVKELAANTSLNETGGVFTQLRDLERSYRDAEKKHGMDNRAVSQNGIIAKHYLSDQDTETFGDLLEFPLPRGDRVTPGSVFSLYRNRKTLQNDQNAIRTGVRVFETLEDSVNLDNKFYEDLGCEDLCDCIFIDGQPAKDYIRKYPALNQPIPLIPAPNTRTFFPVSFMRTFSFP